MAERVNEQYSTILVEERPDRIVVRLNRPEQRNAIDACMVEELHAVCDRLEANPAVMVVTGGDQGVFAGGADIAQLRERRRSDALAGINLRLFERIRELPMPTVAAVDGYALGGGAELAYACDLRIISNRAAFGQPEPRLGIIAGAGATHRLVRLLGESVAKQILLGARTLNADDALHFGLAMEVVPPEDLLAAANRVVDRILSGSDLAVRLTKMVIDAPAEGHPQVDLLAQALLFEDEEKFSRMSRFLEKSSRKRNGAGGKGSA